MESLEGKTYVPYKGTPTPGNGEVVVLFSSTAAFGARCAPHYQCHTVDVSVTAQQAAGTQTLRLQKSDDGGVNWINTSAVGTSVAVGNTTTQFSVQPYQDWRVIYTNGTTPQTAFTADVSIDHTNRI